MIAFEGTSPTSINDWKNNLAFFRDKFPPQYEQAITFMRRTLEKYGTDCVIVTGHSLGGGMAQYVALQHGLRAYIFNSTGLWAPTVEKLNPKGMLRSYIVRFEGQEYFGNGEYGALDLVSEEGQQFEKYKELIPIKVPSRKPHFLRIHSMANLLNAMKEEVQGPAGKTANDFPLKSETTYKKATSTIISKAKKDTRSGCNKDSSVLSPSIGGAQAVLKKFNSGTDRCAQ